jgi:hypothetical protein
MSIETYVSVFGPQSGPLDYAVKVDGKSRYSGLSSVQAEFYFQGINLGPGHTCALLKGSKTLKRKEG